MTIEQKAQRYDEALKRAKKLYEQGTITESLSYVFSELKESEDERIRKELIEYIKDQQSSFISAPDCRDKYEEEENNKYTSWISYLEKQGEKKPIEYPLCKTIKDKIDYYITNHFIADKVTKTTIDAIVNAMKEGVRLGREEQKLDWSEEDKKMSRFIGNAITADAASEYLGSKGIQAIDVQLWLEKLKERVQAQSKQEWSEEDEINRDLLYNALNQVYDMPHNKDLSNWINKRMLLCSQQQWKPSDAQMASITCAVRKMKESACYDSELVSLLNDLKKLKE